MKSSYIANTTERIGLANEMNKHNSIKIFYI